MGNNKKKGSWKLATVGLMLFRCDYAETTIIIKSLLCPLSIFINDKNKSYLILSYHILQLILTYIRFPILYMEEVIWAIVTIKGKRENWFYL